MKVFFNIILIQTILNLYVFVKGWRIIPTRYVVERRTFLSFFVLEILVYAITYICYDDFNIHISRMFIQLCTLWSFFVLYMAIILLLIDAVRLSVRLVAKLLKKEFSISFSQNLKRGAYVFASAFSMAVLLWGNYKFMNPKINHRNIHIDKGVSADFPNPLRVVMFADIHLGYLNDNEILADYIELINKQKPHLVLIGGDIIDFSLRPLLENNVAEELNKLEAPLGVYACLGNHDHYIDEESNIKWLKEKTNITILQDSAVLIDNSIYIVGREDFKTPHKPLKTLLEKVNDNHPVFVLNHQPKDLEEEVSANVDLALYGHTHSGQIFPITTLLRTIYDISAGYEQRNNTHLFVTSGLGGIPQLRIGSESEIIVVDCTFSKTND